MRMATLDQHGSLIESVLEELLVGLDQEAFRHAPSGVGQHAVSRDDSEAFDAGGAGHITRGTATDATIVVTRRNARNNPLFRVVWICHSRYIHEDIANLMSNRATILSTV